jgi:hypothetical protein
MRSAFALKLEALAAKKRGDHALAKVLTKQALALADQQARGKPKPSKKRATAR